VRKNTGTGGVLKKPGGRKKQEKIGTLENRDAGAVEKVFLNNS